jgi:hypothetical protein
MVVLDCIRDVLPTQPGQAGNKKLQAPNYFLIVETQPGQAGIEY